MRLSQLIIPRSLTPSSTASFGEKRDADASVDDAPSPTPTDVASDDDDTAEAATPSPKRSCPSSPARQDESDTVESMSSL